MHSFKMSHRKARSCSESGSQASRVPFSWEQKPGIPKFNISTRSFNAANTATELSPDLLRKSASFSHFESHLNCTNTVNISSLRCSSGKGFWKPSQDDPFAAAIKKCTKRIENQGNGSKGSKNYVGSKSVFSCKKSCDVREDNLVRRGDGMPPLPQRRGRSGDRAVEELERFLMSFGESKDMIRNKNNIRDKMLKR